MRFTPSLCSLPATLAVCVSLVSANQQPPTEFNIREYQARGDGETLDTVAIQQAIDTCGKAGGGRVVFPAGNYLAGTLRLRSGVELHLQKDARLIGVNNLDAYGGFLSEEGTPKLLKSRWHRGLIVGEHLHDITITGEGIIDGNKVFDPRGEEQMRGPHTLLLGHCRNIHLNGLTFLDSANYAFLFYHSQDVLVENVTFKGGWDGVHFRGALDGWNKNLRVANCHFFTGDDSIAGGYIENGIVEDCTINSSCNGVRLIGPARKLTFTKCDFRGPGEFPHRSSNRTNMLAAINLQPSAWDEQPGPLEDVVVRDITMHNVSCPLHVVTRKGNTAQRLTFERIRGDGIYLSAASVESWGEKTFRDVTLRDIEFRYVGGATTADANIEIRKPGVDARKLSVWGLFLHNLESVTLERVKLTVDQPDARPVVLVENVDALKTTDLQHSPTPEGVVPVVEIK